MRSTIIEPQPPDNPVPLEKPDVVVDVLAYNSKMIYVVMDGGGFGEQLIRLPYTGNETVLDAIAQVNGLSQVSSKRIWVARPSPGDVHRTQILTFIGPPSRRKALPRRTIS